jgi:hypothetical protein
MQVIRDASPMPAAFAIGSAGLLELNYRNISGVVQPFAGVKRKQT